MASDSNNMLQDDSCSNDVDRKNCQDFFLNCIIVIIMEANV